MSTKSGLPPKSEIDETMQTMWSDRIKDNPFLWVMYAFPWGQKGTPLEHVKGPRKWQKEELLSMAAFIKENKARISRGETPIVYKSATVSGRGPGKSTLVAWIALWNMSCNLGSTTIITANTDSQLTNKTFGEVGKWVVLSINHYWFDRVQKGIMPAPWFSKALKDDLKIDAQYYYIKGELWNADNADAFVGAHNPLGMTLIFDEASGVPSNIWTVSEGFFTERSIYRFWFAFSNPRANTGAFFECFHAHRAYWKTRQIDSRDVEDLDHSVFKEIIAKHGDDSDEARIEVKGQFPQQGDRQFISRGVVGDAIRREIDRYDDHAALCMGVDVARFGDDSTVIRFRRGRDARSIPAVKLKGADNMAVANKIAHLIDTMNPDAVFIDAGAGAGVIDRLRELGYKIFEVWFGSASESAEYADHRTELWGKMRDWLGGAMIDGDQDLVDDLTGPEYEFQGREDKIKLESKEKMKKRGLASPDNADALAVTFHAKVARKTLNVARNGANGRRRRAKGIDYEVLK